VASGKSDPRARTLNKKSVRSQNDMAQDPGANSLGLVRPHIGLNATPLKTNPEKATLPSFRRVAHLEGLARLGMDVHIGFSMFASLGSMIDIDFGDLIDFLGRIYTRAVSCFTLKKSGGCQAIRECSSRFRPQQADCRSEASPPY